jgi:Tfp pilus assembly protein PilE
MTEQDMIKRFNHDVDQMLENGQLTSEPAPGEYQGMIELAQVLSAHDTRGSSTVEHTLKQRLLRRLGLYQAGLPNHTQIANPRARRQPLMIGLALVAILTLASLSLPSVRALAQDILRTIGNLIITDAPTQAEQYVATAESNIATPTVDPDFVCPDCEPVVEARLSAAQASAIAGFPIYTPAYIPEGYTLVTRQVYSNTETTTIDTAYRIELNPPLHDGQQMAGMIVIDQIFFQSSAQPWEIGVGDQPTLDVTVRGQAGVWLEQIPIIPFQNQQGEWDYARWNQLVWAEAGYNFMIQTNLPSDMLPLDELLEIAASLTP